MTKEEFKEVIRRNTIFDGDYEAIITALDNYTSGILQQYKEREQQPTIVYTSDKPLTEEEKRAIERNFIAAKFDTK